MSIALTNSPENRSSLTSHLPGTEELWDHFIKFKHRRSRDKIFLSLFNFFKIWSPALFCYGGRNRLLLKTTKRDATFTWHEFPSKLLSSDTCRELKPFCHLAISLNSQTILFTHTFLLYLKIISMSYSNQFVASRHHRYKTQSPVLHINPSTRQSQLWE